jgi:hypothetical protein
VGLQAEPPLGMGQAVLDCHERALAPAGNGPRSGPGPSTASPRLGCPAASPGSASCPPDPRPAAAMRQLPPGWSSRRRRHRRVPPVQVSDQRLPGCDPLRLRRDQRITRISGWLPLVTAHRSKSAMIPETRPATAATPHPPPRCNQRSSLATSNPEASTFTLGDHWSPHSRGLRRDDLPVVDSRWC